MSTNNPELSTSVEPLETTLESNVDVPKKTFIEPELSSPVNVLEATTFFQPIVSGGPIV